MAQQKIVSKFTMYLLVIIATGVYCGFHLYQFYNVGTFSAKWHTHIIFTAVLLGIIWLPFLLFDRVATSDLSKKILLSASTTWIILILLEGILVITGIRKDYSEERFGTYYSPFNCNPSNIYHIYTQPDSTITEAPEFRYVIPVNSLGFPDYEWSVDKPKEVKRILILGDSFTEGVGAPYDSSFPAQLRNMIDAGYQTEILNAGVGGSDAVYGIKNLEDRLLKYQPDLVIQMISENDVTYDFYIKGGLDRYTTDSTQQYLPSPWWEPIYAASYTARFILNAIGYDLRNLCGDAFSEKNKRFQASILSKIAIKQNELATKHNLQFITIFYPTKYEMLSNENFFDVGNALSCNKNSQRVLWVNSLNCYQSKIKQQNLNTSSLYWNLDGHHNSKGYHLMASCVADILQPKLKELN